MGAKVRDRQERFWSKVDKNGPGGCWVWTGAKLQSGGYGQFSINNWSHRTHRLSYEFFNGPIPDGLCVLHRCDNPPCVNPGHLFLGDRGDNARDKTSKGRGKLPRLKGEETYNAKLTEEGVRYIRSVKGVIPTADLAREFKVTCSHINSIKSGRGWRHVQ